LLALARAQAPGACQLTSAGIYSGGDVVQRVKELQARATCHACATNVPPAWHVPAAFSALRLLTRVRLPRAPTQPHIKVVMMEDVETGLSQIASALGLGATADVKVKTEDWPFAD
jgi:hypothetical protein